ncbi:MAG: AraC family transcriptional regulator [Bacteroidales bacterium]|nr:AraC family transcriptional regulator [Bacteroidales bacterium]
MVCPRCIMAVDELLKKLGYDVVKVELGEAVVNAHEGDVNFAELKHELEKLGFELLEDKSVQVIEKIKNEIVGIIHHGNEIPYNINFSDYLVKQIGRDYHYLSSLFSQKEGITIEKYIILQKIEKAKELIAYAELSLSQIAYKLNYSSPAHLTRQFKQVTGMTPSTFRKMNQPQRKNLDEINGNK